MLDIKFIRENPEQAKIALQKRGQDFDLDKILALDAKKRDLQTKAEELRAEQKKGSSANTDEATASRLKQMKDQVKKLELELKSVDHNLNSLMLALPNLPLADVPVGQNENDNKVIKTEGDKTSFDFSPKDYMALAEKLDLIDTIRAAKVSGSRFGYLKKAGALLEMAIIQYAMETLLPEGFVLMMPPVMIKPEMMQRTGYSSYTDGQEAYYLEKDKLFLVGTGEHSLITYHADEILDRKLPLRYLAFTTCFRREAGTYGKDTKGILRVHQFDKLEMVSLVSSSQAQTEFDFLLSLQEKMVKGLNIPYQLLAVCTGDLPKPSGKVIDLECWIPSENKYRETHSVSNCTDFQARRLNIRHKDEQKQNQYVNILNGTAFAMPRIIIAIMENYQTREGTIRVPEVLQKYMKIKEIVG
ncbi:MAG: serine--tRNA ligase [bacterium]